MGPARVEQAWPECTWLTGLAPSDANSLQNFLGGEPGGPCCCMRMIFSATAMLMK